MEDKSEKTEVKHKHHTKYLENPKAKLVENSSKKRALPWEDGEWDDFVTITDNGKKVVFELQQGNYNDDGYNGCYPIQMRSGSSSPRPSR